MELLARKSRLGNPLFEHLVVLVVAALAIWAVSAYAVFILEQAECSVVNTTLMNIRSGMRLEQAQRMLQGLPPAPAGGNPVRFLMVPPAGYVVTDEAKQSEGAWYYRAAEQTLYYVPQRHNHLHFASVTNGTVLGWKVVSAPDSSKALTLQTVIPYRWF